MALVKYGGGIIQASGSMAGNTFARNRFGNYMRARTKPVNPNSDRQVVARARLALLTEDWSEALSAVQREAWATYAAAVAMNNRLGETIYLTGFNHFIRTNSAYMQVASRQNDAPVVLSLAAQDPTFSIALSEANGITVTFDDTMDWASEGGAGMLISIGQPQTATRNFFGGPWRYHGWIGGTIPGPTASPDGPTAVTAWTLTEDHLVWVKARIIRADGRLSNEFSDSVVVGA